jgi:hypothetical protein
MSKDVPYMQRWYAHFPGVIRVWLCIYVTVTSFQYLISGEHFSLLTFFFNGGLLLVALLDIARRLEPTRWLIIFTILVFGSDWLLKTVLAGQPVIVSLAMTSTLILQGWLGYFFLCFAGLNRDLPDTQKKVIWFSWTAALFPALISSFLVVLLSLYLNGAADWKTFGNDFLWWSVSRFTSIALVAPAILFLIEQYESASVMNFWAVNSLYLLLVLLLPHWCFSLWPTRQGQSCPVSVTFCCQSFWWPLCGFRFTRVFLCCCLSGSPAIPLTRLRLQVWKVCERAAWPWRSSFALTALLCGTWGFWSESEAIPWRI